MGVESLASGMVLAMLGMLSVFEGVKKRKAERLAAAAPEAVVGAPPTALEA